MKKYRDATKGTYTTATDAKNRPAETVSETSGKRFFFDRDEDRRWYLIPEEWRSEWNELIWREGASELPEWAKFEARRIDNINKITFENPKEMK